VSDSDPTPPKRAPDAVSAAEDHEATARVEPDAPSEALTDERLRTLVRTALATNEGEPRVDVLRGFQKKIRERSEGRFYDEGWSTAAHPPVYTYFFTAVLMLVVLFVVYALLVPTAGEPVPVQNEPAPVQIIPPTR
jgi:hypothetical protein